ncbi:MAG: lamin tail domain-containing protein, partial [Methanomassiliicoccales archaeon]|nr:lamin tail domain-containing protein [Methanomassiliicoccales archaeon]
LGPGARLVEIAANALGEQVFRLSVFGVCMTIRTNPKEIGFQEIGVPASFSLALRAGGCAIDVTSRLIKGPSDFGILTNATLEGDDWSVHLVLDPFMDVFRHMVEVRGIMDGRCLEMSMPEVVSYKEIKFALSDVPGVGAMLSGIPLPIPGLKGSVDAGVYLKLLDGRTDAVLINEYELNPAGEDDDREWVELYNPTTEAVNLAGWSLQTMHGIRALGPMSSTVLMPQGRLVYTFQGQALDNQADGFPSEESIVLRDSSGKRVDSTPFATDYWNDDRTWQRAQDGSDRWEFRDGTKGCSNGRDPLARLDLTRLQEAFTSSVLESLYQLASSAPTMESLAQTLSSTTVHLVQRLSSELLSKEVEIGLFVEVAATDYSASAKVGMRMDLSLRCGTLGEMLDRLGRSVRSLTQGFGNPFHIASLELPSGKDVWIGVSTFTSIGLPKMVSLPGMSMEVQYVTTLEANLAALSALFGSVGTGWGVEGGAAIRGVPASSMPMLDLPSDSLVDLWLCRAALHEAIT